MLQLRSLLGYCHLIRSKMSSETSTVYSSGVGISFSKYLDKFSSNGQPNTYANGDEDTSNNTTSMMRSGECSISSKSEKISVPIAKPGILTCRRYSPSKLLLLKNESLSKSKPSREHTKKLAALGILRNVESVKGANNLVDSSPSCRAGRGLCSIGSPMNQKSTIDYRCVSSNHLMPAFAKRRYVTNNNVSTGSTTKHVSNIESKDRLRKQEDIISSSPQKKLANANFLISQSHLDRDMPTTMRERRIGSGRLVARDVSWDYSPEQDKLFGELSSFHSTPFWDNSSTKHTSSGNNIKSIPGKSRSVSSFISKHSEDDVNDVFQETNNNESESSGKSIKIKTIIERNFVPSSSDSFSGTNGSKSLYKSGKGKNNCSKFSDSRSNERNSEKCNIKNLSNFESFQSKSVRSEKRNHIGNQMREVGKCISKVSKNRYHTDSRCDEPEWFSSGPTSQHDTIELHGFDENDEFGQNISCKLKTKPSNESKTCWNASHFSLNSTESLNNHEISNLRMNSASFNDENFNNNAEDTSIKPAIIQNVETEENIDRKTIDFNFDEILQLDSLNDLLTATDPNTRDVSGSRFTQWFNQPSQTQQPIFDLNFDCDPPLYTENYKSFINGSGVSNSETRKFSNDDKYFSPISCENQSHNSSFLEFLQKGKFNPPSNMHLNCDINHIDNSRENINETSSRPLVPYKQTVRNYIPSAMMPNVEELEALMRKNELQNKPSDAVDGSNKILKSMAQVHIDRNISKSRVEGSEEPGQQKKDMEAFKKLLEQITPGGLQASEQQGMQTESQPNLLDDENVFFQQTHSLQPGRQKDFYIKLAKENTRKCDIMKAPDAQKLIHGLARGEITQSTLMQHLTNSATAARNRETVASVLNFLNANTQVGSPVGIKSSHIPPNGSNQPQQVVPGVTPITCLKNSSKCKNILSINKIHSQVDDTAHSQVLFQQTNQKKIDTSTISNGVSQRIPSPRELQYHTQTIMQSALIKKKLEEQQEKFRRRQELQKQQNLEQIQVLSNVTTHDGNICGTDTMGVKQQISSPSQIAFTPTSVLRKMTADKDVFGNGSMTNFESPKLLQSGVKPTSTVSASEQHLQPRMILGSGGNMQQQSHQQIMSCETHPNLREDSLKWNRIPSHMGNAKPIGRPILKGGPTTSMAVQLPLCQSAEYSHSLHQQTQHQISINNSIQQNNFFQFKQELQQPPKQHQVHSVQEVQSHQFLQQYFQQRKRTAVRSRYPKYQFLLQPHYSGAATSNTSPTSRSNVSGLINGATNSGANINQAGVMSYQREGGLSPTSNQLARWFSPELLAQASAGKLPSLNVGQALSLEEFERSIQHSSTIENN